MSDPRPCERQCKQCKEFKHHSRYHSWKDRRLSNSTVAVQFRPICRDCEQKNRNEKKNDDRPKAIIDSRARQAATKAHASLDFFWVQMNYRALVPIMRAYLSSEGLCIGCGHSFVNERDIQIEHVAPPRGPDDWARLHARNLRLMCGSCNRTKSNKAYEDWLDEQEGARISNLKGYPQKEPIPNAEVWHQLDLLVLEEQRR